VKSLLEEADKSGVTLWKLVIENVQGIERTKTNLAKLTEQGLSSFVNLILTARKKISNHAGSQLSIAELVDFVIKKISLEEFLERGYPEDHVARWANIQELMTQAAEFSDLVSNEDDEALPKVDGLVQDELSNPLSKFLANIALASASDTKSDDAESSTQAQVTISTIHAAKGLEWPVVFVPATYEGSIPHSRSDDTDEERRLLYVAMTRAQALLYMSYPLKNSQREQTSLSQFLASTSLVSRLSDKGPSFTSNVTQSISKILNRTAPGSLDERLLTTLESLEDDILPTTGEDVESGNCEIGGNHSQNERPFKRQRTDHDKQQGEAERRRPATTVISTTFSMAQKSGFTSAGSHMRALKEQSINSVAEKSAWIADNCQRGLNLEGTVDRKSKAPALPKRFNGQGSLKSFFRPTAQPISKINSSTESSGVARRTILPKLQPSRGVAESCPTYRGILSLGTESDNPRITPTLSSYRLGSASLRPPTRKIFEDDASKKAYVFLSSSPPRPNRPAQDAVLEASEGNASDSKVVAARTRPAKTTHVTSFSMVNNNAPRKTLGVRRSINGWSSRKSQGHTPQTLQKPS
jgi:DNA helicase II / ATP-dependent DNA helicase PcrA